ncbi:MULTISPECIES: hypothetical protein [unclassified Sinorhizobium]
MQKIDPVRVMFDGEVHLHVSIDRQFLAADLLHVENDVEFAASD